MKSARDSGESLPERLPILDRTRRDFLDKLEKSYIPPYIAIFRAVPYLGRCPAVFQVIFYGLVFLVVSYSVAIITDITAKLVYFWSYVGVAAAIMGVGLWALWYVRRRTVIVLQEVVGMMTSAEQIARLDSCLELMYSCSKLQLMTALGFPTIAGILIMALDVLNLFPNITFPRYLKLYAGIIVFLCITVAGFLAYG